MTPEELRAEALERARSGERAGWMATAEGDAVDGGAAVAVIVRPAVRMGDFHALPFVAAMGAVDAFRGRGAAGAVGIRWPNDLVCGAPAFDAELAKVEVKAGAGEGGMFAVVAVAIDAEAFAGLGLGSQGEAGAEADPCGAEADAEAEPCGPEADAAASAGDVSDAAPSACATDADTCYGDSAGECAVCGLSFADFAPELAASIVRRVDAWAAALAANKAVAGPLAPVLNEYFDMVPALGHRAAAVSPNGHPLAIGTFAGIDVWGRATIKTTVDEREFAPEVARIRTL